MLTRTIAVAASLFASAALAENSPPLTKAEQAAGWRYLFDGTNANAFRGYKPGGLRLPKGWEVVDGTLHLQKGGGAGDLVSRDVAADFELSLEFKCAPGANSGIMYRVADGQDTTWRTGPEFQILDDAGHPDGKDAKHRVGSLYDMIAAPEDKPAAPAGQWNTARIRVSNGLLQHFLNGKKVVETRIDGQEWKDLIAGSKFKDMSGFGVQPAGRIALQDHGDEVWYRNIRFRDLKAKMPGEVQLFNGKDFSDWTWTSGDGDKTPLADVWTMKDGLVSDRGTPNGYLATKGTYTNFVLRVSWRWDAPPAKAANSGVLVRVGAKDEVWPRSVEAQLMHQRAGDFYSIGGFPMKAERMKGNHTAHLKGNERPQGEWNEYEIIVDGPTITLWVNGEELNRATDVEVSPGRIALQSEGGQIWFRDVRLAQLD